MILTKNLLKLSFAALFLLLSNVNGYTQIPKKLPKPTGKISGKKILADTLKKKADKDSTSKKELKSYAELLKKATTLKGLFKVHQVESDYYFEIPLNLMEKDFLIVNKISSVPLALNESGVNKGVNFDNKVIRFSRNKLAKTVWVKTIVPQVESAPGMQLPVQ
ncbi:DUF5118 domain-containing protein [Pedobacter sp. NJ-S-72]